MKSVNLLVSVLVGILLFNSGCARSVLDSQKIDEVSSQKAFVNKTVYCLPKGMIHFQRKAAGTATEVTVETLYVPDPEKYYTLEYVPNPTYEENITVSLTKEMLLKKIDITSKPKIGEILMKVFELAREIAKLTVPSAGGFEVIKFCDVMIDPKIIPEKKFSEGVKQLAAKRMELKKLTNDLKSETTKPPEEQDKDKIEELKQKIKNKEKEVSNQTTLIDNRSENRDSESLGNICNLCGIEDISLTPLFPKGNWLYISPPAGGIKYRPLLPYRLEIQLADNLFVQTVYLPNEAPVITLDVTRPAFADQVTSLSFENGVLTQADLTRPSEILAFMKLPVDLVKAVAGLPLDLIQFRVQNVQQYNALMQAQIEELRNKQTLMELQQKGKTP